MRKMLLIAALVLAAEAANSRTVAFASTGSQQPAPQATNAPKPDDHPPVVVIPTPVTPVPRHCTTLSGETFEWSFPNVPFGAASCS